MTKPYDKADNDTYKEILGGTPIQDVKLHMFRDCNGRAVETTVDGVEVRGNFTSESDATARDNVLQFATSKVTGLKAIKTILLETLLPMSLVSRYGLGAEKLTHTQQTPIYFDAKLEKFVVLLDKRFLRDINLDELKLDDEVFPLMRASITAYEPWHPGSESKSLGMLFDTIDDIRNACKKDTPNSVYGMLKGLYRTYRLLQFKGEKVIVIKGMNKFGQRAQILRGVNADSSTHAVSTTAYYLEFVVAYKFGNQFYLVTEDGKLDQRKSFSLDKLKHQNPDSTSGIMAEGDVLVAPYSDHQLAMLTTLAGKLNAFHEDVMSFLKGSERKTEQLDAPLGSVQSKGLLQQLIGQ